jgi:uncharacterized protein
MNAKDVFLTAEWRYLLMANYAVDPAILQKRVPRGTELDSWSGQVFVSVVGFNFINTRIKGVSIPFHRDFEEINLRFYVRRRDGTEWRRGVVFVKEIVPRPAIAFVARTFYNEIYVTLPTRHTVSRHDDVKLRYEWRFGGRWNRIEAIGAGNPVPIAENSEEQFITEHYWGYSRQRNGGAKEYQVEHPQWSIWKATNAVVDVDVAGLYGGEFVSALSRDPTSVFIADGSEVSVSSGVGL